MNKKNADQPNQYPVYSGLNLPSMDAEILEFWAKQDIFKKSIDEFSNYHVRNLNF